MFSNLKRKLSMKTAYYKANYHRYPQPKDDWQKTIARAIAKEQVQINEKYRKAMPLMTRWWYTTRTETVVDQKGGSGVVVQWLVVHC